MLPKLPPLVTLLAGLMVSVWGLYRIRIGFRSAEAAVAAKERGGLYGLPNRTHILWGIIFLLMGVVLILNSQGIRLVELTK